MDLMRHINACHDADMTQFLPFYLGDVKVGAVHRQCQTKLRQFLPQVIFDQNRITLSESDFSKCNRIFAEFGEKLAQSGHIHHLSGENFPILPYMSQKNLKTDFINDNNNNRNTQNDTNSYDDDGKFSNPLALIDRKIVPFLGIQGFGVHLNGIIRNRHQDITHLWIARRSHDRAVAPNKLDNMVAGGQGAYFTPMQTLIKEAAEEAALPAELLAHAKYVATISYQKNWDLSDWGTGLRNDVLIIYDLDIPPHFIPKNTDGEIAEFFQMSIAEVSEALEYSDDFKFNVNLVQMNLLLRHGLFVPSSNESQEISQFFRKF